MRKWLIIFIILLIGCNPVSNNDINEASVVIGVDSVHGVLIDGEIYAPVDALEKLNINVLKNDTVAYLSVLETEDALSNDRSYNWYIDQGETGIHSGDNCGPSSSVMAAKWQKKEYDLTPKEARDEFQSSGGWWYTDDIEDYFDKHDVVYKVDDYDGTFEIVDALNDGSIVLLCVDTSYITEEDDQDSYFGRFYSYAGGHFLIVKGYRYIDYELYFEVYDSNCWGETYSDGSPKGKDRLYPSDEVESSVENWWDYYFIIEDI